MGTQGTIVAVCSITTRTDRSSVWSVSKTNASDRYLLGTTRYPTGENIQIQSKNISEQLVVVILLPWVRFNTTISQYLGCEVQSVSWRYTVAH